MKCVRCSAEIPAQSRFCLRCGTAVPTTTSTSQMPGGFSPTTPAPFVTSNSGSKKLFAVIGLLAIAVLALGAFVAKGLVQKKGDGDKGQLVQAPGMGGAGTLVQAPGDSRPAPMVQAPGDSKRAPLVQQPDAPLPTDVMDYLAHLRKVEATKHKLLREGNAYLQTLASTLGAKITQGYMNFDQDGADPRSLPKDTAKMAGKYDQQWNELNQYFRTKQPPASCAVLAQKYQEHLDKIQTAMIKIIGALESNPENLQNALQEMQGMKGGSGDIDAAMNSADRELDEVCRQFRLRKDFDISDEKSGGGAGMFGL